MTKLLYKHALMSIQSGYLVLLCQSVRTTGKANSTRRCDHAYTHKSCSTKQFLKRTVTHAESSSGKTKKKKR